MNITKDDLPKEIRRLDEAVVNRIAAGEIIQRPANALKELLENALDAGSTSISVIAKQGGLQLLQISDNGSGIRKDDLTVVCERFTTSKLREFSDLQNINTYGFRGEALASISHVAKLTILTKTKDEKCGFKCSYTDGKLIDKPKPCAANQGTTLTVEDLFFNVPTRKRVLKSPSEEFQRISDVVSKYAIHNTGVGFSLKKTGDTGPQWSENTKDIRTQANSSLEQNVAIIYGTSIEKELIEFNIDQSKGPLNFKASGRVTGVNYNTKKAITLFFINNRLVDSPALKRSLDIVYGAYLPKGTHPFIYLSLEIHPANVDVNVHPTKHEVHFLYQDEIVELIQRSLDEKLMSRNSSRTFKAQAILPGMPMPSIEDLEENKENNLAKNASNKPQIAPKNMVRTDSREQKMDKFVTFIKPPVPKISFGHSWEIQNIDYGSEKATPLENTCRQSITASSSNANTSTKLEDHGSSKKDLVDHTITVKQHLKQRRDDVDRLASIQRLRQVINKECEPMLRKLIANHSFVGSIDRQFALVQHETSLYIINTPKVTEEMFYQIAINDFGNFDVLRLNPPAPISALAEIALDNTEESGWTEADGDKTMLAKFADRLLKEKREMLDDYLSIKIDENGNVLTIPILLEGYVPYFGNLPIFLLRLATEVDYEDEEECFRTLAKELARFYAVSTDENSQFDEKQHEEIDKNNPSETDSWMKVIETVVFPALKSRAKPSKSCITNFVSVANLPDLYKVFERC